MKETSPPFTVHCPPEKADEVRAAMAEFGDTVEVNATEMLRGDDKVIVVNESRLKLPMGAPRVVSHLGDYDAEVHRLLWHLRVQSPVIVVPGLATGA